MRPVVWPIGRGANRGLGVGLARNQMSLVSMRHATISEPVERVGLLAVAANRANLNLVQIN